MRWIDPPPSLRPGPFPDLHPLIGQALVRRGISTPEAARAFLDPNAYPPSPSSDLPGMEAAVTRLTDAIRGGESICVWGDFDVDGQTATAILVSALRSLGADVSYHIPVRATEGHGIRIENLMEVLDSGVRLVLTCDTGITAGEAVEFARSRGVDVVITDHHDLGELIPAARAVINPKMLPADHPLATLAGAGVAYKLAESLLAGAGPDLLDFAALGLIGDLALLRQDTRFLVQRGLEQLRRTERMGLKVLMEMARVSATNLNEEHVGFELAPRLNAIGRLGDANPAVELLLTEDPGRARVISSQLEGYNAQRKLLSQQVYQAAEAQLHADPALLAQPIIILDHPEWPAGIIGLAAAQIARQYGRPAILFTTGVDGVARGSARSIEGVQITQAIAAHGGLLRNFGGHPMAAGLSLDTENLPEFRRHMSKTIEQMLATAQLAEASLQIDAWLDLREVSLELAHQIGQLAPFGPGNPKLILATRTLSLKSSTSTGRNREHLKMIVEDLAGNAQTVQWWGGAGGAIPEGTFDLAYTLRASDFRGNPQLAAELVDWRETEAKSVEARESREVLDWRTEADPQEKLRQLIAEDGPHVMVWAEGENTSNIVGLARHELSQADTLVIWTAPPSRKILQAAIERVQPKKIIVVAADPARDEVKPFLERLTGLVKFALQRREGGATWESLAAAAAHSEAAVRLGVDWLSKRGEVTWQSGTKGEIRFTLSDAGRDSEATEHIMAQLHAILNETAAFRTYFMHAEKPVE